MEGWSGMSPTAPPARDELLGDPWYSRLKEYLIESTGLAYYANKDEDLARRIRRRFSGFGSEDCASYLERLRDPSRGPAEMDALIAEITIGETYFFRHREHFDALRAVVLPDLIARNASVRRLRIWCAGCADGSEPYSLSILLRREFSHLLIGWNVSILGTDINRHYLATARTGRFEEWALRATSADLRHACFQEKGKHWIIAPEYKAGVSFQFHNLVENASPPLLNDFPAFDLIVCRNVMIYFGPELIRRTIMQFHACLEPRAWLLVGPSEPNASYFTSFRAVNAPGVTLYQRHVARTADYTDVPISPDLPGPLLPQGLDPPPETALWLADAGAEAAVPKDVGNPAITALADLRQRADRGDWENAARCGKVLLESDNLNPLVHFHYALVLEQMGNRAQSERSFRRAIYLDRQAVLAHYHLGLLLQSRGDLRQAKRCFENTLNLLASQPGDAILAGADGISVAELSKLAGTRVEILGTEHLKEQI
jgi:chemotaxis protein methyltransferase CheR